ncbi:O-antigen ligase domain-containing protein [Larsenimonas salina]|uniref:O-antigen ligase domain-containing protein n=1 Tax=Larsenimonas salina TaxID=1295565 RepID=UPI002073A722|nr:O-antigen ligase domain-containing protein [Larsenimonas salina]MCM5703276.1 O-antigen ligase domain-containing protein [Larsenimonas salina]
MDSKTLSPQTPEERIVWLSITATYPIYVVGGLYVLAPVLAWSLLGYYVLLCIKKERTFPKLPFPIWAWIIGMIVMEVALLMGHMINDLGTGKTIKSSIGWAKGWALLAVFPILGCLPIRIELIARACMKVCLYTILLLPVFVGAWAAGLPQTPYVSPLKAIGGPGPEFFALSLYEIDPGSGLPRWRLFTPWAPAVGFVANIYFVFALIEQNKRWKAIGMFGSVLMILMSGSRMALVAIVLIVGGQFFLQRLKTPGLWFTASGATLGLGVIGEQLMEAIDSFITGFKNSRADSTRVRAALGRIAVHRWKTENPTWGHGIVERGPHLVEYMPIGSHHSWYGLLFVKGIVGFYALAAPMAISFLHLLFHAPNSSIARSGLIMVGLLVVYSFGENLEILAYLIWPGLMLIGKAHHDARLKQ